MPIISIIIPVYNVESFLSVCIESVLSQTFEDYELILVDDGSTDQSANICDKFAEMDERIKVIHEDNKGVSSARNTGINKAKGEYIMFCDADDIVDIHWCEYLYKAVSQYPDYLVVCKSQRFCINKEIELNERGYEVFYSNFYEMYKDDLSGSIWNKIFSNKIIQNRNIRFDVNTPLAEDVLFVSEYFSFCKGGCIIVNKNLYYYRNNPDSALHGYNPWTALYHVRAFYQRAMVIEPVFLESYCDEWLYGAIDVLGNIFDLRNSRMRWIDKLQFNQNIVKSKEFQFCISNCSKKNRDNLAMRCLSLKNYFLFYIIQRLATLYKNVILKSQTYYEQLHKICLWEFSTSK